MNKRMYKIANKIFKLLGKDINEYEKWNKFKKKLYEKRLDAFLEKERQKGIAKISSDLEDCKKHIYKHGYSDAIQNVIILLYHIEKGNI